MITLQAFPPIEYSTINYKLSTINYFKYSEKSVSFISPLRASVSCIAKAAVRQ